MLKFTILLILSIICTFINCNIESTPKCGDGKCHGQGIETCFNCEIDCGRCNLQPIHTCIEPGKFALTFDDGPTDNTSEILDILKSENVKATFFVLGRQAANPKYAPILKRACDEGHTIGSHSFSHPNFLELSDSQIIEEIKKTEDSIYKTLGKRPKLFRFPYLYMNPHVESIIQSLGYMNIHISIDSFDWREKSINPTRIRRNILDVVEKSNFKMDSFISLQHDTTLPKLSKIKDTVGAIRSKGFELVNIQDCLGLNEPPYAKEGDTKVLLEGKGELKPQVRNGLATSNSTSNGKKSSPSFRVLSSSSASASKFNLFFNGLMLGVLVLIYSF